MKEDLRIDFKGMKINNNKEASKGFLKQISYYKKSPPVERLLKDAKSIFLKERFPESKTILVVIDDVRNARDAEALIISWTFNHLNLQKQTCSCTV